MIKRKKGLDFEDLLPKNLESFDENWRNGGCFSKLIFFFSRYMQQIFSLGQRIQRFEDLLKGQDVLEKLEQLEQKMYQIQDDAKDKFEELNNEVADNATRISSTENQNIEQGKEFFWKINKRVARLFDDRLEYLFPACFAHE